MPLDLRLLARGTGAGQLARTLLPVATAGLLLAATTGALLFITAATDYAASPFFLAKLVAVALGVANALALRRVPAWSGRGTRGTRWLPIAAALSILLWLAAIVLGRLIGYF